MSRLRQVNWLRVSVLGALFMVGQLYIRTEESVSRAVFHFPRGSDFVQVGYPPKGLHYVRAGQGQNVVLIHGDGGSTYDWTMANFDRLSQQYDVIAIDRPGFGFSETLPHQSIISQVRYIHRGLQLMGIRRPVLVGHSRGGEVATLFAEEYPNEIAGVVTLGGTCFITEDREPAWQFKILQTPVIGKLLAHTLYVPVGKSLTEAGFDHAFSPEGKSPETYQEIYTALMMRPQTLLNWATDHDATVLDSLIIPRYKSIRVPFVVVNGQLDRNVPVAMARRYSQMIPGSQLLIVPDAGHELMFRHPEVVERAIGMVLEKASQK